MSQHVATGRIIASEEHRSFSTVYRYRCMAWGTPATAWEFVVADKLPVGLRVRLFHGPLEVVYDDAGGVERRCRVQEASQSIEPSRIIAPFECDAPWPGYHEPDERVKAWAVEQAEAMGIELAFEKSDDDLWALVAHTARGAIRIPLVPGGTWRDAFESVGMTAYPA